MSARFPFLISILVSRVSVITLLRFIVVFLCYLTSLSPSPTCLIHSGQMKRHKTTSGFHRLKIFKSCHENLKYYYISKLVHALWLVNLVVRTLMHGPLKFKVVFVAKLLRDLSPNFLTYIASKSLKLSFTLNCVLKRANDLKAILN